jgi:hypothetical protein
VSDVTDTTIFDPIFSRSFALRLVAHICEPLTQSNQKLEAIKADYMDVVKDAKRAQAFEVLPIDGPPDEWWLTRCGGQRSSVAA